MWQPQQRAKGQSGNGFNLGMGLNTGYSVTVPRKKEKLSGSAIGGEILIKCEFLTEVKIAIFLHKMRPCSSEILKPDWNLVFLLFWAFRGVYNTLTYSNQRIISIHKTQIGITLLSQDSTGVRMPPEQHPTLNLVSHLWKAQLAALGSPTDLPCCPFVCQMNAWAHGIGTCLAREISKGKVVFCFIKTSPQCLCEKNNILRKKLSSYILKKQQRTQQNLQEFWIET